jgi:TolA-binding protein
VQRKLDELNATAHRTGADVVARQDQLQQELASLRGMLEEESHRLAALDAQLKESRLDTEGRFAAIRGAGALDQFEARKKLEALKRPPDPQGFLAVAREQDAAGEKAVARELYEELAKKWPKDPAAAEAHYRLGELAAADGKHREAVLSFGKVAQEFPRSERAPEAMLRTGEALVALDMRDEAVGVLRELQAKYPAAPASRTAKARVDELTKKKAPAAPAPKSAATPKKK